jgi:choline dehydrogenase-like flavoprotein
LLSLGYHPAPIPIGVMLPDDEKKRTASMHLSHFDGYPDPTESKADSHIIGIRKALQYDNVTLLTGVEVEKLETDHTGKTVRQVIGRVNGKQVRFEADTVIVSCGAINSAALLLKSKNEKHPQGLANSSGLVGRNLMLHNNGAVIALVKRENNAKFQKSLLIADFYHGKSSFPYPMGSIQLMGKSDPDTIHGLLKEKFGQHRPIESEDFGKNTIDFFITTEDLPNEINQVKLMADGSIQLIYQPNNLKAYATLKEELELMLDKVDEKFQYGYVGYIGYKLGISGVSHQSGTCVFGHDAETSVLDIHCKAHDLDNLYVVDTSFFPSSAAVNPSLTAMANALRVGDHLIKKWSMSLRAEENLVTVG